MNSACHDSSHVLPNRLISRAAASRAVVDPGWLVVVFPRKVDLENEWRLTKQHAVVIYLISLRRREEDKTPHF